MNKPNKLNQQGIAHILLLLVVVLVVGGVFYLYSQSKINLPLPGLNRNATVDKLDQQEEKGPSEEAVEAQSNNVLSVYLGAQNNSNEVGMATITKSGTGVIVKLDLKSAPSSSQPAHIHTGACPKPGAIKYPLNPVTNGTSQTTLNVSLQTLKQSLPLAINVHKSQDQSNVYVSCGDVKL